MSQQALRQQSVRNVTGTALNYEGDFHALFDMQGIPAGPFNGRMLQYINTRLSASYTNINSAMAAMAAAEGASNFQAIGTFTPGVSLTAPVLTWTSASSDATPEFDVDLTAPEVNDVITLQWDNNSDFSSPISSDTNTVDAGEAAALLVAFVVGSLADGTYYFRSRHSRGATNSDWSNTETVTISTISAEVAAYLARATGMDATHVNAFTALIDGLVADGVWAKLDALYVPATDTEAHAKLNLVSTSYNLTETGTVPWTADQGYTVPEGAGVSHFLSSGFVPSTAGGQYALNSAHMAIWANSGVSESAYPSMGCQNGSNEMRLCLSNGVATPFLNGGVNNANFSGLYVANTNSSGFQVMSRTASNLITGYKNGSSLGTATTVSSALVDLPIYVGCGNITSVPFGTGVPFSAASFGSGLSGADVTALYSRLGTYRTAVGL